MKEYIIYNWWATANDCSCTVRRVNSSKFIGGMHVLLQLHATVLTSRPCCDAAWSLQ